MTTHRPSHRQHSAGHGLRGLFGFLALMTALFLAANTSQAGGVLDGGGFFSEQAKVDAGKTIGEMERTLHKDLTVETFKGLPADQQAGLDLKDKAAVGRVFEQWAKKQFLQKHAEGVYALITKDPAHLEIAVGTDTQRQAFTLADRDALKSLMLGKLHAHQYDDALRDGANFVFATMKSHAPNHRSGTVLAPVNSRPSQTAHSSGGWLIPAIVIGLVVWIVIGIFRALAGRMGGGGPAMGQAGGGGGGFLSSLVGGMFGAAAGMWMYDQFFSHHGGSSAYGSDVNDQSGDGGFSGHDTDSTSSGGDFGDSSGGDSGGDWGGGDSGGGDSGGGDF